MAQTQAATGTLFVTEKRPVLASGGMVVTNHPLASAAGMQMLAAGGNAVDATVAALFALTVVEPMMVGILGGGFVHLRLPDGTHTVLEGKGNARKALAPTPSSPIRMHRPAHLKAWGDGTVWGALRWRHLAP